MSNSKGKLSNIKDDIKKGLDFYSGGGYKEWIPVEYGKDLLIFKTLVLITRQNEKMIKVLNEINNNIIRTIDPSR